MTPTEAPLTGSSSWSLARVPWPVVASLVAMAVGLLVSNGVKDGPDDPFNYFKASGLMLGQPLPKNPAIRRIVDSIPPVNYQPHAGVNLPYRDFQEEYPPLALVFFVLPRLATGSYHLYVRWFAAEMALLYVLLGVLLWRLGLSIREAAVWWALFALGASYFIVRRFDAAPTLFAAAALVCFLSSRSGWAGLLLGLGAATKLWPGLLVPIFLLPVLLDRDRRSLLRITGGALIGFFVPHLPFIVLAGGKAFSYLGYHGSRGIQVESLWGNLAMLLSKLTPLTAQIHTSFGAAHVTAPTGWTQMLVWASYAALILAYGAALTLTWRALRSGRGSRRELIMTGAAAVLFLLLATAKVFSSQFVVWLFPLAFALPRLRGRVGVIVAALLTGLIYPYAYYDWILTNTWTGDLLVLTRNVVVGWLLWEALHHLRLVKSDSRVASAAPTCYPEGA